MAMLCVLSVRRPSSSGGPREPAALEGGDAAAGVSGEFVDAGSSDAARPERATGSPVLVSTVERNGVLVRSCQK